MGEQHHRLSVGERSTKQFKLALAANETLPSGSRERSANRRGQRAAR
jgi:hypothetical protein